MAQPSQRPQPRDNPRDTSRAVAGRRPRTTSWGWLLVIPVLLVAYPPLYNHENPTVLGLPFFYAYQLLVIPISVLCTAVVYVKTSRRSGDPRRRR